MPTRGSDVDAFVVLRDILHDYKSFVQQVSIEVGGLVTGELDGEASRAGDVSAPDAAPALSLPGRTDIDALGLVVGTVPATPLRFSVGLAPGQYAQLDDVVVTRRELPGQVGAADLGRGDECGGDA